MEQNPHIMLTPADFTDTGQWRLIIYISREGMSAYLMHLIDRSRPILRLMSTAWTTADSSSLLSEIESAIFDNPRILDDYATDIIIETPQVCFVPNDYLLASADAEQEIFGALFPGDAKEVISDRMTSCTALFSMVRGLDGFIARTIPGARLRSHLAVLVDYFNKSVTADSPAVFLHAVKSRLDIILFKGKELMSASVQQWQYPDDIIYRIFNLLNAYGINPALTKVNINATAKISKHLISTISPYVAEARQMALPVDASSGEQMPLAAMLLAFRN